MVMRIGLRQDTSDGHRALARRLAGVARALLVLVGLVLLCCEGPSHAADCPTPLFVCETDRSGKFITICAVEEEPGQRWSNIQYRFGRAGQPPEMVFPHDPAQGATALFFSHEYRGKDYYVSIRFSTGGYTYRVFSDMGKAGAGVTVSNATGKVLSTLHCIERPAMFPAYLQRALVCDLEHPHGTAACGDKPYTRAR